MQRLRLRSLFLGLLICQICSAQAFAQDKKIGRIHRVVACESLLWTISQEASDSPREALQDLAWTIADLLFPGKDEYLPDYTLLSTKLGSKIPLETPRSKTDTTNLSAALARTDLLLDQTETENFDAQFAGRIYRGESEIAKALTTFTSELAHSKTELNSKLREIYPKWRFGLFKPAISSFALWASLTGLLFPDEIQTVLAVSTMSIVSRYAGLLLPYVEALNRETLKIDKHLNFIRRLKADSPEKSLSIWTTRFAVPTSLYNTLMKVGESEFTQEDILEILKETEDIVKLPSEKGLQDEADEEEALKEEVRHPDGKYRILELDSFAYVDPKTKEPVWILSFRAHKTAPYKKPPPKKKVDHVKTAKEWFQGLLPTPEPIPVPIPVK